MVFHKSNTLFALTFIFLISLSCFFIISQTGMSNAPSELQSSEITGETRNQKSFIVYPEREEEQGFSTNTLTESGDGRGLSTTFQLWGLDLYADKIRMVTTAIDESSAISTYQNIGNNVSWNLNTIDDLESGYVSGAAQEFEVEKMSVLYNVSLWFNYSIVDYGNQIDYLVLVFKENFESQNMIYIGFLRNTIPSGTIWTGWINITDMNLVLDEGNYHFAIFWFTDAGLSYVPASSWILENNVLSGRANNGTTSFFNASNFAWETYSKDEDTDLIMKIGLNEMINPSTLNARFTVTTGIDVGLAGDYTPTFRKDTLQGYIGEYTLYFDTAWTELNYDINITVTVDAPVPTLNLYTYTDFINSYESTTKYSVSPTKITWNVSYTLMGSSLFVRENYLTYESDWTFEALYDPTGAEVDLDALGINFGTKTVFNKDYNCIIVPAISIASGEYTAVFSSPNYLRTVTTEKLSGDTWHTTNEIEIESTARISVFIADAAGNPVTEGVTNDWCEITLLAPNGTILLQENITEAVDGYFYSSNFKITDDWETEGQYNITVFWSNGVEIGYTPLVSLTIVPRLEKEEINWLPYILLLGAVALSTPTGLFVKHKMEERGWEKSLHNLFVFSNEGLCAFDYTFSKLAVDSALVTGMISAISQFVAESMQSEQRLRAVDHEDRKILLEHQERFVVALVAEKDLHIIHKHAKKFAEKFAEQYGHLLERWTGDLKVFATAEALVLEVFRKAVEAQKAAEEAMKKEVEGPIEVVVAEEVREELPEKKEEGEAEEFPGEAMFPDVKQLFDEEE